LARPQPLVEMPAAEKNRTHRANKGMQRDIEKPIAWLDRAIERLETDIDDPIKASPRWHELARLLGEVKSVGAISDYGSFPNRAGSIANRACLVGSRASMTNGKRFVINST